MSETKRRYEALCAFSTPASEADLAKALAGEPFASVTVKKGAKLPPPSAEMLRSWQANDCVKEVN